MLVVVAGLMDGGWGMKWGKGGGRGKGTYGFFLEGDHVVDARGWNERLVGSRKRGLGMEEVEGMGV